MRYGLTVLTDEKSKGLASLRTFVSQEKLKKLMRQGGLRFILVRMAIFFPVITYYWNIEIWQYLILNIKTNQSSFNIPCIVGIIK